MQAEFEAAAEDGRPLEFAIGCLTTALREMIRQSEGRSVLATYALAIGLLLPMAALQFRQAISFSVLLGGGLADGALPPGVEYNPYLVWSQNSASPVLLLLWLLLVLAHLCLAWVLVESDWQGVVRFSALIGATTITLLLFTGVLMLDLSPLIAQLTYLGIEFAAISVTARRTRAAQPV